MSNPLPTKTVAALEPGMVVQYRRVGQARLVAYQMKADSPSDRQWIERGNEGWWTVEWVKAPKKYREAGPGHTFWVGPGDVVA